MNLEVRRIIFTRESIIGNLFIDDVFECFTLELPWKKNQKSISCIPEGKYKVIMEYSPRFNRLLPELKGVPERDEIKIHPANWPKELNGCIAVGKTAGQDYIGQSRIAFELLLVKIVEAEDMGEEVWISVKDGGQKKEVSHVDYIS